MEIIQARFSGFCFGVRRAVKMAEQAAEKYGVCYCLGPLTHNEDVVCYLEKLGIRTVERVEEIPEGVHVIIRSHGAVKEDLDALRQKGADIIDATCPDVARVHMLVESEAAHGRKVLIFGTRSHPEVSAAVSRCPTAEVFSNTDELLELLQHEPSLRDEPLSVVSQTTEEVENFENNIKIIKKECTKSKIFDTICSTTTLRQAEAGELASKCGAIVVIGGKNSANSQKLAEICRNHCENVYFIHSADELPVQELRRFDTVGITAGASTPEWIIKEVNRKMSDEIMAVDTVENNENTTPAEEATQVEEETQVESPEAEASFEELLERSIKTLHTGEKVSGTIASITQTEVSVDLGTKQSGYIPISELTDEPGVNVNDIVKVGDQIEAYVMRVNDVEGTVMLSKKRLDSVKAWNGVAEARNTRAVVEGTVVEENKGGVVVSVKGVRVFVPASQSGLPKDTPMSELLKKKVRLHITEVNQPRRRVVGSIRAVLNEERRARAEAVWNEIEVGKRYHGVVKSLTSYGAFVDIGGIDGMVHVSELTWRRIHQPSEVVAVGDELDVYVISFDKENKKISLGCKDPKDDPWIKFTSAYSVGSVAEVKIVKLMEFGAFAEIVPGVDGLIHISQIADRRIGKPSDVLSEGQITRAKIINIDEEHKKVSLSIRALTAAELAAPSRVEPDEGDGDDEPVVVYDTDNPPVIDETEA